MFRSCGEAEAGDAGRVVAGQVDVVAVACLVVAHVVVQVAVDDHGAELEDDFGAVGGPSGPGDPESVFDDEAAGSLDHAGGDRPAGRQCLVVAHVRVVVRQVGDGLVDVGEVEVAGAGAVAGLGGDGGQGGGDGFGAAVQHAQQLPVGPLPGGLRAAGVQRGGGFADIAADVDVVDEDRDFQAAVPGAGGGGGGDGDDLGHLLDSRMSGAGFLAGAGAVPGAHRDALAVGLHHDHVAVRQVRVRAEGPLIVELVYPAGQVLGDAGQLRPPGRDPGPGGRDPGPGGDDLLGLPVPAFGQ